jgi:hypothetical protein
MNAISNPVNLQILQILILTNWVGCPWLSEPGFTGLQDEQDGFNHTLGFVAV